jgi:O2-independent ubiquinone biosynthesis accessory factor UbiT
VSFIFVKGFDLSQHALLIPKFPPLIARALGGLPLLPLSLSLTAFSKRIARQQPGLFRRLGDYGHARFVLDPTDLPFVICLEPNGGAPRVTAQRGAGDGDARIAGPLAALLGLVHGAFDGDALFFSRDLVIEGDTSAALALRNAIDDAELDLGAEIGRLSGPFARPLQRLIDLIEDRTGVALSRAQEVAPW